MFTLDNYNYRELNHEEAGHMAMIRNAHRVAWVGHDRAVGEWPDTARCTLPADMGCVRRRGRGGSGAVPCPAVLAGHAAAGLLFALAVLAGLAGTAQAQTVPPAPTNLMVNPGNQTMTLSWTTPDHAGSAITKHQFRQKAGSLAYGDWTDILDSGAGGANANSATYRGANGVTYTWLVRAVNAEGESGASNEASATPVGDPPRPTGVRAMPGGDRSVRLSWTTPGDGGSPLTKHQYRFREPPSFFGPPSLWGAWTDIPNSGAGGANANSYTVSGLTNGVQYQFQLRAVNTFGNSIGTFTFQGVAGAPPPPTPPPAPANLRADPGDGSVALSWTTPGDGGSAITKHQYREKEGTGSYGGWGDIPNSAAGEANANSYTVPGRDNGTAYTYQVRAVNAIDESDPSNEASATPVAPTKPPAPANLRADGRDGSVALSWTTPGDGGSAITKHQYREKEGTGSYGGWGDIPNSAAGEANANSYTVPGRDNGTAYTYQVRAVNAIDESDPSNEASATPGGASTTPPAPANLRADPGNDRSVALSWTTPGDGGSAITKHQYRFKEPSFTDPWGAWTDIPDSAPGGANATGHTVSGLTNAQRYQFQVRAVNAIGDGTGSFTVSGVAGALPPAPTDFTAIRFGTSTYLTWTTPGQGSSPILRHQVRFSEDGTSWQDIPDSAPGGANANSYTRTLSRASFYSVRAVNAVGRSASSDVLPPTMVTNPTPPTLTAAPGGDQSVALSWTASEDDGGSPITKYQYRLRYQTPEDTWHDIPGGASANSYTVPGLTNGEYYSLVVRAHNGFGGSQESNIAYAYAGSVPPAPTSLTADLGDGGSVTLSWTTPGDGGSAIINHQRRSKEGTGSYGSWSTIPNSGAGEANANSYTFTRLVGREFTVEVRARNAVGPSDASNTVTVTPANKPPAPANLVADPGNGSVSLRWTTPGDGHSPITKHQFRGKQGSESYGSWSDIPNSAAGEVNANSYTVSPLDNGEIYTFQVRAVNAIDESDESNEDSATPRSGPVRPPAPANLMAEAGDRSVALSWTTPGDGGSAITKHQYREKEGTGSYGSWSDIPSSVAGGTNANSYTVAGRDNGTAYTYQVRAVNAIDESDASNEDSATPASEPPAPTNLMADPGDESVALSWTTPGNGGSAITAHWYREKEGSGSYGSWSAIPNSAAGGANANNYTVPNRMNGTTYTYQVGAVNAVGESGASNEASATPVRPTKPPAPANLMADPGNGSVALSWTTPGDGHSPITKHQFRAKEGSDSYGGWG